MSIEVFRESVKDFLPYLIKVNLYDEGEPLLNKSIPDMVGFLNHNNVATCISSNLSLNLTDDFLKQLLSCGLDHLVVAVDGATQETYSSYRKGGDLLLVIKNLKRLIAMKKEIGSSVQIELQFLEFPHNKSDRAAILNLAGNLGVDRVTVKEGCSIKGWEGDRFAGSQQERRKLGCYQLWLATTINSIGEVGCCDYGEDHGLPNLGNARNYNYYKMRNSLNVIDLRRSFGDNSMPLNEICQHCSLTRRPIGRANARR